MPGVSTLKRHLFQLRVSRSRERTSTGVALWNENERSEFGRVCFAALRSVQVTNLIATAAANKTIDGATTEEMCPHPGRCCARILIPKRDVVVASA